MLVRQGDSWTPVHAAKEEVFVCVRHTLADAADVTNPARRLTADH